MNLLQGMGRETVTGYNSSDIPEATFLLGMGAVDFETIALLEMHNPLALWKYAVQHARVRESTRVTSFSSLDEYSMYRRSGQSYYSSDEKRPSALFFTSGGGLLRQEIADRFDFHGVPSPSGEGVIEVTALHQTVSCPLYIRYPIDSSCMLLLVEIANRFVWIVGPVYNNERERLLHKYYYQLGEAIGYWLWQFSLALNPIILKKVDPSEVFTIGLTLFPADSSLWDDSVSEPSETKSALSISIRDGGGGICLTCRPSCYQLFHNSDNAGEREMMRVILSGLAEALHCEDELGPTAILAVLDQYAPLGSKKKILVLQESNRVELAELGNEAYRPIQDSDQNEVLDDIGRFLVEERRMVCAPVLEAQRVPLLNEIVGFLFRTIAKEVQSYSQLDLLASLVRCNDAVIHAQAQSRFTTPSQLACYGDEGKLLENIRKSTITFNDTATAARFLVEYVVARPPKGDRPLTVSALDRLLACSSQLQRLGNASDALKYEVEDISLSILPSGRLGSSRESDGGINSFNATEAEFSLLHCSSEFGRVWAGRASSDEGEDSGTALRGRVEQCTKEEWGVSLGQIVDFMAASINVGFENEQTVVLRKRDTFLEELSERTGMCFDEVNRILEISSLGPRADFLSPPSPHTKVDVYPWRYNRSLSYARRPFLLVTIDGTVHVMWGVRHVHRSGVYLHTLVHEGRVRASTDGMRVLAGELNKNRGNRFNHSVARVFSGTKGNIVFEGVKKLGPSEDPLSRHGDIDVLVVNLRKRSIQVIECKDLSRARNAFELSGELKSMFEGNDSIVRKHSCRVAWCRRHVTEILSYAGQDTKGRWIVSSAIVVSEELVTSYLKKCEFPVISLGRLTAGKSANDGTTVSL